MSNYPDNYQDPYAHEEEYERIYDRVYDDLVFDLKRDPIGFVLENFESEFYKLVESQTDSEWESR